ncbi:unnamed protein product [Urochloa humidicola]
MPSRSSPPPYRGRRRGGDAEQPSMESLSLRPRGPRPGSYSPERTAASRDRPLSPPLAPPSDATIMGRRLGSPPPQSQQEQESISAADSTPDIITAAENDKPGPRASRLDSPPSMDVNADVPGEWHSFSPALMDDSIVGCGAHAPLQLQLKEESESGSELDSSPRITFRAIQKNQEPRSPTSPPGSPPLVDVNLTGSPKYSSSDEEDPYFEYLVDNFIAALANTCNSTLSDDDIDYKAADQRHSVMYAKNALKCYNNLEKKEVKYELISGITSSDILVREGCFGHVNFTAKRNQNNSKEELFFAELRWDGNTPVPTCVVSLEGIKSTCGLRDSKYDKFYADAVPMDEQNCYACHSQLKHPKNGELYKMGHVAMSDYYMM